VADIAARAVMLTQGLSMVQTDGSESTAARSEGGC
jgi:hypothetical protein